MYVAGLVHDSSSFFLSRFQFESMDREKKQQKKSK